MQFYLTVAPTIFFVVDSTSGQDQDTTVAPSRSDVNVWGERQVGAKHGVAYVMRCALILAAFPTAAVAKHPVAAVFQQHEIMLGAALRR